MVNEPGRASGKTKWHELVGAETTLRTAYETRNSGVRQRQILLRSFNLMGGEPHEIKQIVVQLAGRPQERLSEWLAS